MTLYLGEGLHRLCLLPNPSEFINKINNLGYGSFYIINEIFFIINEIFSISEKQGFIVQ